MYHFILLPFLLLGLYASSGTSSSEKSAFYQVARGAWAVQREYLGAEGRRDLLPPPQGSMGLDLPFGVISN